MVDGQRRKPDEAIPPTANAKSGQGMGNGESLASFFIFLQLAYIFGNMIQYTIEITLMEFA